MEWKPRAPREGINVSKVHPLREALLLVAGLSAVLVLALFLVSRSVDWAVRFIPAETEARVFASLPAELASFGFELGDGEDQEKARQLLARLAGHWPEAPYDFHLRTIPGREPNALALPGGLILLTQGLLERVESENELALVLGHELGHYHNRDHLRRLGRGIVYSLVLAALTGGDVTLDPATFAGDLASRGFDRRHELEADRFGLGLVAAEYGHVAGSWCFFERLVGEQGERRIAYFSTHPAHRDRIEAIQALAREAGWPLAGELRTF